MGWLSISLVKTCCTHNVNVMKRIQVYGAQCFAVVTIFGLVSETRAVKRAAWRDSHLPTLSQRNTQIRDGEER